MKVSTITASLLCLLAASVLLRAKEGDGPGIEEVALFVNQQSISLDEFRWFMEQERVGVLQEFGAGQKGENGKDIGSEKGDGQTPRRRLQQKAIERVVREKVEQLLFQELGLIQDVSYAVFLDNLEKLNREREAAAKQGRVVYGPVRYTQMQYYGHWKATLQMRAKEKLEGRLDPSEPKLQAYYERNKDLFKREATMTLELATAQEGHETDKEKLPWHRYDLLTGDRLSELFSDSEDSNKVLALVPGQLVSLKNSDGSVRVVKCISKTPSGHLPYEKAKSRVRARYIDEEYDQLIKRLASKAEIKLNPQVIDSALQ